MPVPGTRPVDPRATIRTSRLPLFSCGLYSTATDCTHRSAKQADRLRHSLPGYGRHAPDPCRRPETSRRSNRFLCRSSHLGPDSAGSSSSALRHSGRRALGRFHKLDLLPPGFLPVRESLVSSFPPFVPPVSGKRLPSGQLEFSGSLEKLRNPGQFRSYLAPLKRTRWVVYAKAPFAGPRQVLDFVGRYTHRVAISNNRLFDIDDGRVTFHWKDYRDNDRQKKMTLPADEFIRRFLIHVLPDGFQRIRYYGFLSNCHREEKLALCRQLLAMPAVDPEPAPGDLPIDYDFDELYETLTGSSLRQCPLCRQGRMVAVEILGASCSRVHRYIMTPAESRLRQTQTHKPNRRRRVSASSLVCPPEHSRLTVAAPFPHQSPSQRHVTQFLSRYRRTDRQTSPSPNLGPRFNTRLQFNDQGPHIVPAV